MKLRHSLIFLLLLFLSAACTTLAEPTPTALPTATQTPTITVTPTPTSTPTPTLAPTPIGSAGYARLAIAQGAMIKVIELETERELASVPGTASFVRFSPDGSQLAYNNGLSIDVYNLDTKESKALFSLPEGAYLDHLEWSPSSAWLSYSFYMYGDSTSQFWVHNIDNNRSTYISRGYYLNWLPEEDRFIYQSSGGGTVIHNPANGAQQAVPRHRRGPSAIESHNFQFSNYGCRYCYLPELNAFELDGFASGKNEIYYHLFDADTRTEKAFVAHLVGELPVYEGYQASFYDILALSRGDYILYITEGVGEYPNTEYTTYSIWNPQGTLPIEISFENDANRLADVMPVQLSADESVFLGLHPDLGVVMVDVATAEIRYSYPVHFNWSNRTVGYKPNSIDLYWGN